MSPPLLIGTNKIWLSRAGVVICFGCSGRMALNPAVFFETRRGWPERGASLVGVGGVYSSSSSSSFLARPPNAMDMGNLIPPTVEAVSGFLLRLSITCISAVEGGGLKGTERIVCMLASSSSGGGGRRYRYPCHSANEIEGHLNRSVRSRTI